ncbi:MAG: hypothetical protein L3I99_02275 [Sulfurimonas sp.]|nr:hypothetical protein [Sulfurimonas sp.]
MIIYNNKKEFIGIDEENLKSLGYSDLVDLQSEAADFGDLFVKTPGHVHNFKHVHWIDFILCEENKNACKAIIHTKKGNFNCILEIKTIYLTSSPNSKSYIINLNNLKTLSSTETSDISSELQTRNIPVAAIAKELEETDTKETQIINTVIPEPVKKTIIDDPYETKDDFSLDSYELSKEQHDAIGEPDVINKTALDSEIETNLEESNKEETSSVIEYEKNNSFDIEKTAEILEMDIATIKDFVNDFVSQAKDFKNKLYNSVVEEDLVVLKALSHQLKGVAANLRIHDCQDILVKINKADNFTTSKADLDTFYELIANLSGTKLDKPQINETQDIDDVDIDENDDYILEIDDTLSTETKNKTETLEIEDDDYILEFNDTIISTNTSNEDDNIPDIEDFDSLDVQQDKLFQEVQEESSIIKYNKVKIAEEIGLDTQSFDKLFDDYLDESEDLISIMEVSIENDDPINWNHSALKLKGMSDNMRIDNFIPELQTLILTDNQANAQEALIKVQASLSQIIITKD